MLKEFFLFHRIWKQGMWQSFFPARRTCRTKWPVKGQEENVGIFLTQSNYWLCKWVYGEVRGAREGGVELNTDLLKKALILISLFVFYSGRKMRSRRNKWLAFWNWLVSCVMVCFILPFLYLALWVVYELQLIGNQKPEKPETWF